MLPSPWPRSQQYQATNLFKRNLTTVFWRDRTFYTVLYSHWLTFGRLGLEIRDKSFNFRGINDASVLKENSNNQCGCLWPLLNCKIDCVFERFHSNSFHSNLINEQNKHPFQNIPKASSWVYWFTFDVPQRKLKTGEISQLLQRIARVLLIKNVVRVKLNFEYATVTIVTPFVYSIKRFSRFQSFKTIKGEFTGEHAHTD